MKTFLVTLVSVLVLAVAGIAVYAYMIADERSELREELASVQQELESTRAQLTTAESDLSTTKVALASSQAELSSTQETLTFTESELASTSEELDTAEDALLAATHDLDAAEDERDLAETKLSVAQGQLDAMEEEFEEAMAQYQVAVETLEGLDITLLTSRECYDAELVDNPDAVNPTWAELKAFLAEDRTEHHEYILNVYDCSQFSRDLHNRAEAAGIRAAVVHIDLIGEYYGHALNAFLTTDYGLIYIDCTEPPDTVARVKSQYEYRAVSIPSVVIQYVRNDNWWTTTWSYYYIQTDSGGVAKVDRIIIYW